MKPLTWPQLKYLTNTSLVKSSTHRFLFNINQISRKLSSTSDNDHQLTLALLKPDIVANPNQCDEIIQMIVESGLFIARSKKIKLTKCQAEKFYEAHVGRFFYSRLVHFMSSGPLIANILVGKNSIDLWRKMMGPTKVFKAIHEDPNCIRARYGLTDTRNVTHGSDSVISAESEINFFFPEFNIEEWKEKELIHYKSGNVTFCSYDNVHKVKLS